MIFTQLRAPFSLWDNDLYSGESVAVADDSLSPFLARFEALVRDSAEEYCTFGNSTGAAECQDCYDDRVESFLACVENEESKFDTCAAACADAKQGDYIEAAFAIAAGVCLVFGSIMQYFREKEIQEQHNQNNIALK